MVPLNKGSMIRSSFYKKNKFFEITQSFGIFVDKINKDDLVKLLRIF